jgi:hypothetical protein
MATVDLDRTADRARHVEYVVAAATDGLEERKRMTAGAGLGGDEAIVVVDRR